MSTVTLIARAILIVIFVTAGAAKLADFPGTLDTLVAFGVPYRTAKTSSRMLPVAELATAVALIITPAARWGGAAAALLLVVFLAGIGSALRRGLAPDCNCFGQLTSETIGPRTLLRNVVLLAIAVFVIAGAPGSSFAGWTTNSSAANAVAATAVLLGLLLLVLAMNYRAQAAHFKAMASRRRTSAGAETDGLKPGDPAPEFALAPAGGGEPVRLATLLARARPILLVFASPTCGPCQMFLPELARWNGSVAGDVTIAVIETGVPDDADFEPIPGLSTLVTPDLATQLEYGVQATPSAVLIGSDRMVAAPQARGAAQIEALLRRAIRERQTQAESMATAS